MNEKNVMVVGMARSGIAAAVLLRDLSKDTKIRLSDAKSRSEMGDIIAPLEDGGFEWRLGTPPEENLDGIELVVISPGVPIGHPVVKKAREMGIKVIGEVELAARVIRGRLIAITGTNGKTTTTSLVGEMFKNAGVITYVVGNIGFPITAVAGKTRHGDAVICEISSFQMESVEEFYPSIAAVLNIKEDHLDRHGTMEEYISLKARVFQNQEKGDYLVLNYDDPETRKFAEIAKGDVVWFSRLSVPTKGAYVEDGMIVYAKGNDVKRICSVEEIGIPGSHNLENALAAVAIAMTAEIPSAVIRHSLRSFKGVEHRIEFCREVDGVRFINDSKGTNCDSTIKAIEAMDRDTVIILGGYDKNVDLRPVCEALLESRITHAVLIGQTAKAFEEQLKAVGFANFEHGGSDFEKAVRMAAERAKPGGNVLLSPACASFDMFDSYEQRGGQFKDIVQRMGASGA